MLIVPSAFYGETDRLLKAARDVLGADPEPFALAEYLMCGERAAAALIVAGLVRVGLHAELLDAARAGFLGKGRPSNAEPVSLDSGSVVRAMKESGIAVLPGFGAVDDRGRALLLGRGGSDASAVFCGIALGAEVRLLKDVDGLYDRDPADSEIARRYAALSYLDASALGGRVLQDRACNLAAGHGHRFRVESLEDAAEGRERGTLVGVASSVFDEDAPARCAEVA